MLALALLLSLVGIDRHLPPGGVVIDARTAKPVAGAEVTIVGSRESVRTGPDGTFTWIDMPPPPVVVVVVLPDGRVARPIRIEPASPTTDLRLIAEAAVSDTVTVRGVAPGIDVAPGTSGASVTAPDLGLRRPVTIAQALENIPGVSVISEGQSLTPAIRGLSRGRTLLLLDGARISTERGAGPNASFLDPGSLTRVDIARGPGSVAYGTDALGGVIAARSRWPSFGESFRARLVASAGTGVPDQRADLELSHGYGHGGLLLAARTREFGDYDSPAGTVPNSSWRDAGVRLFWAHATGATRWSAAWVSDEARHVNRPRNDADVNLATSPFERSHRLTLSAARGSLGAWREVRVDAFVGLAEQRNEQQRLPGPGRTRRIDRADGEARDLQVRATGRRAIGNVSVHTGLDAQGRFGVSATDTAFMFNAAGLPTTTVTTVAIASAHRTGVGVFGEADWQAKRWVRLSGGVRAEGIRSVNEGGFYGDRTMTHQPLAGMAAVTMNPARDLAVTAQLAHGFREPTLTDRFSRGVVGRGFLEGNPDLAPETSRQFDLTARYDVGPLQVSGAYYRYDLTDLVERYSAGVDLFRLRNRGHARLDGVELDARLEAGRGLTIDLVAQASRGRDVVTGAALDDVAPRSIGLIARHLWRQRVSSYLRLASIADHPHAGPSEVATPGYFMIDAAAGWRIDPRLELRASLRNALDASYYSSAGPRWVWAPGRQVSITLVVASR